MAHFGWEPSESSVARLIASLPHPAELAYAAPNWMGDGMTGDLLPYLAYYEVECRNPDGSLWKAKEDEPPYIAQTGNNCTSEAVERTTDLLQLMEVAEAIPDAEGNGIKFQRTCVEATYAFGLYKGGRRGDNGANGSEMAEGASEIGVLPYRDVAAPYEETYSRLRSWANDPASVVKLYGPKAAPYKFAPPVRIRTWAEYCALIANKGIATVASNVGYEAPSDARRIVPQRSSWPHQMTGAGVIRSDGIETAVLLQSWGPGNVNRLGRDSKIMTKPQPFNLPSFAFRVRREDFEEQLAAGDTWGFRAFPGVEKAPLPSRWTGWSMEGLA